MYCGYIVEVKELRPHTNADRLSVATFFGNDVCVGLDTAIGDRGVYFPCDGQLSVEFCEANNLVRKKDDAGNNIGGYMDRDKRNITAIRLRGEKSDGLYLPISCFEFTGVDINTLTLGTQITVVNGIPICQKYIPNRQNKHGRVSNNNKTYKKKYNFYPYFVEHIDTPQLRFNKDMFKPGDIICLTEKIHGTSSRNGYTIKRKPLNFLQKLFHLNSNKIKYDYVNGTRRTIVSADNQGFYGTNAFRDEWSKLFKGKLMPGEEVFGEIAGFYDINCPIMAKGDNFKLKDKNFITTYGPITVFSYGCSPNGLSAPLNRYFIYRMTYTSPEGYIIEYPWDLVKHRAEQMGFETVPELDRFIYTDEEDFLNKVNSYLDIPSSVDQTHIIEGVVIRALNKPNFVVAKEKSFSFKVLEGIIKNDALAPDMEEREDLT